MSKLKDIHALIVQAEIQLRESVEQQERQRTDRPVMYTFVYEQTYKDVPGWGPNQQYVEAYGIAEAFTTFGGIIQQMGLTVRNINYGTYDEMEDKVEEIRQYWKNYHEQRGEEE